MKFFQPFYKSSFIPGILGGSNAFNFINFVAAVVTLVVNVNNNINNNNNNLNNIDLNTNNANNADANVNNQGANIVIAMPGRRRKRSSVPIPGLLKASRKSAMK